MDTLVEVPWFIVALIVVTAAFVSWRLVDVLKRTLFAALRARAHHSDTSHKYWWTPLLALVSVAIGTGVGTLLSAAEWVPLYGAAIGAAAGAQPVWIIIAVKAWIRSRNKSSDS